MLLRLAGHLSVPMRERNAAGATGLLPNAISDEDSSFLATAFSAVARPSPR